MPNTFAQSIAVVAAVSAAAAGALTSGSMPNAGRVPTKAATVAAPVVHAPASEAYLRATYGISAAEAQRRLALQRDAPAIAADLAARFPGEFAGAWIDQARGGVLIVAATETAPIRTNLLTRPDAGHLSTVKVTRSLRQLRSTATEVAAKLGVTVGAEVAIDEVANEVVVTTGRRVAAGDPRLAGVAGAAKGVRTVSRPGVVEKSCDPLHCFTKPMRGGIRIDVPRDNGTVGGCTTGFNLRSGRDLYIVTAGHCVGSGTHTHIDTTSHDGHPVSVENQALVNYDPVNEHYLDYAIMPYQPGAVETWFGRRANEGLVNTYCPGGCQGSTSVAMTGFVDYTAVQTGWVVCASGAGYTPEIPGTYVDSGAGIGYKPGIHCGEVDSKASGSIGVKICARAGDSGGPLFLEGEGKALGILTDGDDGSGPCTNPNEHNYYTPISKILTDVNAGWAGADFTLGLPQTTPTRRGTR
ncbi:streptogrisin C [Allocatelliglobosispora scoriae]|uniref:Streptogrisin C n=1 Tax=Allocatelliglobosispora scoriae TaxID=643052 RepID=A0A841BXG5_9ACTN|nr:trypsin-like serine protease [Allocatelliglobosispora scoriae]MBB5871839.1 streptogrisin C [Allocatelliglobosispora scoriae]